MTDINKQEISENELWLKDKLYLYNESSQTTLIRLLQTQQKLIANHLKFDDETSKGMLLVSFENTKSFLESIQKF